MDATVDRVRSFNRAWTEIIGLLDQGLLDTEFSLPQARVLYELNQQASWELADLRHRLDIDKSFLTRVVSSLSDDNLVRIQPSPHDARRKHIELTTKGRRAAARLDRRSTSEIKQLLADLTPAQRNDLTRAMTEVLGALNRLDDPVVTIRTLEPGDLGWVTMQHGELYGAEYGWNTEIESLSARILADFHDSFRAGREQGFIAEVDGARAGSLFLMEQSAGVAQIRLVLATWWSRGNGIGAQLVDAAIDFARNAGYDTITLWTNSVLGHARRIYEAAGFELVTAEDHHSFGQDLTGQTWELSLVADNATGKS